MHVALNKFLQELDSLSPGFLMQIESLYPLEFNIEVSSMAKFSVTLDQNTKTFNFFEHPKPNFSLQLNIFSALNALNNKKIPTQSISGDAETALILLSALARVRARKTPKQARLESIRRKNEKEAEEFRRERRN